MPGNKIESLEFDVDSVAATTGEVILSLSPGEGFNGARMKRTHQFGIGEVDVVIRTLGASAESGGDISITMDDQDSHTVDLGNRRVAGAQGMRVLLDMTAPSQSAVSTVTVSFTGAQFLASAVAHISRPELTAYPLPVITELVISNWTFGADFDPPGTYDHDLWLNEIADDNGSFQTLQFGPDAGQGNNGEAEEIQIGPLSTDGSNASVLADGRWIPGLDTNFYVYRAERAVPEVVPDEEVFTISYDVMVPTPSIVSNASGAIELDLHYEPNN